MILEQHGVDSIEEYRPLALENFQIKIITKIIVDRLTILAPKIIPRHQRDFTKSKHTYECIRITTEAINMLENKSFRGSMALKRNIRKAFDTLD